MKYPSPRTSYTLTLSTKISASGSQSTDKIFLTRSSAARFMDRMGSSVCLNTFPDPMQQYGDGPLSNKTNPNRRASASQQFQQFQRSIRENNNRRTEGDNKVLSMRYLFQQKIASNFITIVHEVLVEEATEVSHRPGSRLITELEGFWRLHESNIIQTGTETRLTTRMCTSASKVEPR